VTRVAILISGGGSNMVKLVDSMTGDHPARPVLVLSNVPGAGARAGPGAGRARPRWSITAPSGDRAAFEAALWPSCADAQAPTSSALPGSCAS
jgi:phosphoribosylglycinamide formyltransferase 1